MSLYDMSFADVKEKAALLKELYGEKASIYLRHDSDFPYSEATGFEAGGTVRLGMNTSGYFTANAGGIAVKRSFDLESWGANGTGALAPNIAALRAVMAQLRGPAKKQFAAWIAEVAANIRKEAAEWRERADSYGAKGALLAEIAESTP